MTEKELWNQFITENNIKDCEYEAYCFGVDADLLADLVVKGIKTATASAYPLYELDHEPLPKVDAYSIILNANEEAVCIIKTTKVYITPFCEVTKEHAYKEGEGDRSLAYWRSVHEDFFKHCLEEYNLSFHDDMKVVCEEFQVVFKA